MVEEKWKTPGEMAVSRIEAGRQIKETQIYLRTDLKY